MPSPVLGPGRPRSFSPRPARTRVTRWEDDEGFTLEGGNSFQERRIVTYLEEDEKMVRRGPWVDSEVQDSGPLMSPGFWERMREDAYASGYKPPAEPRRYLPG